MIYNYELSFLQNWPWGGHLIVDGTTVAIYILLWSLLKGELSQL